VCVCVRREFSHESSGERILKIGPYLPKLMSNIKGYTFSWHSVYTVYSANFLVCKRYYNS